MNIVVTYTLPPRETAYEFRRFLDSRHGRAACHGTAWCIAIDGDQYWFVPAPSFRNWTEGRTYVFLDDLNFYHSGMHLTIK